MPGKQEILLKNKKFGLNYEIVEKYEAGISLRGFEVKTLKNHEGSISESYISIKNGEAFLVAAHIPAYQPKNTPDGFDPDQPRRLLLNSKEIQELTQKIKQANLTVIPISMYNNGKKIKLEIALARGKKKFDHRQSIKKKDIERDLGRRLKN
jgi:SsrA-binding protein